MVLGMSVSQPDTSCQGCPHRVAHNVAVADMTVLAWGLAAVRRVRHSVLLPQRLPGGGVAVAQGGLQSEGVAMTQPTNEARARELLDEPVLFHACGHDEYDHVADHGGFEHCRMFHQSIFNFDR